MADSVYIHIPFCKSKCKYCSFISFPNMEKKLGYFYSLLKEIDTNYNGEELKTLYFGGGTPSLMEIDQLKKIINKFKDFNKNLSYLLEQSKIAYIGYDNGRFIKYWDEEDWSL